MSLEFHSFEELRCIGIFLVFVHIFSMLQQWNENKGILETANLKVFAFYSLWKSFHSYIPIQCSLLGLFHTFITKMNCFLVLCLCVASALASDDWGGHETHSSIKSPAFVLPIPEIGLSFDKIPFFIPLPKIVLSKKPALISKPVFLPLPSHGGHGFSFGGFGDLSSLFGGFGGGHGGASITINKGGHGGGGHGW